MNYSFIKKIKYLILSLTIILSGCQTNKLEETQVTIEKKAKPTLILREVDGKSITEVWEWYDGKRYITVYLPSGKTHVFKIGDW